MNDWKQVKWGDLATLEYGKGLRDYKEGKGDYPVFGTNGPIGWHNVPLCPHAGVIIGRKGAYRGIHYSDHPFFVIDTAFYLSPKTEQLNLKWAYYQLLTVDINSMDSGSAIPSTSRNDFYNLKVRIPSLKEQKAIAAVLSAFDDKIELNRQMNATLEEMARALFKSWFVDFDPVRRNMSSGPAQPYDHLFPDELVVDGNGRELPKGWQVKSLDKIAHYQNGLALQKYPPEGDDYLPVVKIRELRQGFVDDNSNQASPDIKESCILYDGDVVFSWSGSLLVDLWCGGKGALNQHLFKVTSEQYPKWFYYYWTKHHLDEFQRIAAGKATTMGHIKRSHLSAALATVPAKEVLELGTAVIAPLIEQIINNNLESQSLATLRDTLLPRLMSGQLRVPLNGTPLKETHE